MGWAEDKKERAGLEQRKKRDKERKGEGTRGGCQRKAQELGKGWRREEGRDDLFCWFYEIWYIFLGLYQSIWFGKEYFYFEKQYEYLNGNLRHFTVRMIGALVLLCISSI